MGRALLIVVLGDPAALKHKVTQCTRRSRWSFQQKQRVLESEIPPFWFPNISMWSSYLETSWRYNTDLQSSLRGTQAGSQPGDHHHEQIFAATSFAGSGCMWSGRC